MARTTGSMDGGCLACFALALIGCGRFGFTERSVDSGRAPDGTSAIGCETPSAGLVSCFSFEGNGADSTQHDDVTTTAVTYEAGRVGEAVRLGASSLIKGTNAPAIHLTTTGTVAAWIRLDALPATGARSTIIDTNSYGLTVLPTGDVECFYTGTYHTFPAGIAAGAWTHLACTYDGAAVTLWKNGAAIAMQPDSGPVKNTVSGLQLGSNIPDANHPNPDLLVGLLDEAGIWSASLTPADVCALTGSC